MIDLPIKLLKNIQRPPFMLSISSTSHFVKLQAIPMQQLREVIELELHDDNYMTSVTNLTDDVMSLKVAKNRFYSTLLTINRYSYNPLEVEVRVDYSNSNEQDLVRRKIPTTNQSISFIDKFSNYRLLWFGMFFLVIVFMVFSVFISILISLLNQVSLSVNPLQQAVVVIGAVIITAIFWIFMFPIMQKKYRKSMMEFDLELMVKICEILRILREDIHTHVISRCWSCFKEINRSDKLCPFCTEQQN